ncbi:MAG TPA: AMP-binding protein, partial [Verrucomicrobiae bacterium]|nr:AMP-binding protein [Verrucomicrobiae bacterium]
MTEPLWRPSPERIAAANLTRFCRQVGQDGMAALYRWSIAEPEAFWRAMWDFAGIVGEGPGRVGIENPGKMPGAHFFPEARLNYAENLLRRRDDADALVFWGEDKVKRRLSHRQLYDLVSRLAQAMKAAGVGPGDRVAGFVPNMPETIAAMLATASLGAIWSSCSPDFGVQGVLDRFGQIAPKLLITADGYWYGGKSFDSLGRIGECLPQLPSIEG